MNEYEINTFFQRDLEFSGDSKVLVNKGYEMNMVL